MRLSHVVRWRIALLLRAIAAASVAAPATAAHDRCLCSDQDPSQLQPQLRFMRLTSVPYEEIRLVLPFLNRPSRRDLLLTAP